MDYKKSIEDTTEILISGLPPTIQSKIKLYSQGAISKIVNAEYALNKLKELNIADDTTTSTTSENELPPAIKIYFYLDAFFAFLYSVYDVSGQIINQKLRINYDEHKVSLKRIKILLDRRFNGSPAQTNLENLLKTRYFVNLERYRNCSTHRRQICIQIEKKAIEITPGYTSTSVFNSTTRVLCDDPLKINPTFSQNRELISYCETMLNRTKLEILNH